MARTRIMKKSIKTGLPHIRGDGSVITGVKTSLSYFSSQLKYSVRRNKNYMISIKEGVYLFIIGFGIGVLTCLLFSYFFDKFGKQDETMN